MRLFTSRRPPFLAVLALGVGGLLASCSGGPDGDAKQQLDMKKGFTDRPPISQLPPAQKQRAEAMKEMAENMAKSGPSGAGSPEKH